MTAVMTVTNARRHALLACWHAQELQLASGYWRGHGQIVHGSVANDLMREGLLTIERLPRGQISRARLSTKGMKLALELMQRESSSRVAEAS